MWPERDLIRPRGRRVEKTVYAVMAGLGPAIHEGAARRLTPSPIQFLEEVSPFPVFCVNQPDLPGAGPMLDIALALNRRADILVEFLPDEAFQPVPAREPFDEALAMLVGAPSKVCGDAHVERSVRAIRHDVDPAAAHASGR